MSTRKILGSKAGRCVRLTTCHLLVPNVRKIRGLNLPDPHGLFRPVAGQLCFIKVIKIYTEEIIIVDCFTDDQRFN
jgi:hypothetical protein